MGHLPFVWPYACEDEDVGVHVHGFGFTFVRARHNEIILGILSGQHSLHTVNICASLQKVRMCVSVGQAVESVSAKVDASGGAATLGSWFPAATGQDAAATSQDVLSRQLLSRTCRLSRAHV